MFTVTFAVMVSVVSLPQNHISLSCPFMDNSMGYFISDLENQLTSLVQQPCKYNLPSCVPCPNLIIPFKVTGKPTFQREINTSLMT